MPEGSAVVVIISAGFRVKVNEAVDEGVATEATVTVAVVPAVAEEAAV